MPGRSRCSGSCPGSSTIFTGTRCTTFTKLPVAFSGGSRLNRAPVAAAMLSTCALKFLAAVGVHLDDRALARPHVGQLRLLEVRGHPDVLERDERQQRLTAPARSGRPRPFLRDTTPATGAFTVVYCRFSSACASAAFACSTCASAAAARALRRGDLLRPGLRGPQRRPAPAARRHAPAPACFPRPGCPPPPRRPANAADSTAARCASAAAAAASNCCCDTSSLASSPRSRSTSRADFARVRLGFALARLRGRPAARAPRRSPFAAPSTHALRLRRRAPCAVVDVARRRGRGDRHAASARRRRWPRRRRARRGRLIDRHLIVARIELHEHRAGFDALVVFDRHAQHRAADARRDLRHVRIHLRIVGRLASGGDDQPDDDADDREQRRRRARCGRASAGRTRATAADRPLARASENLTQHFFSRRRCRESRRLSRGRSRTGPRCTARWRARPPPAPGPPRCCWRRRRRTDRAPA